MPTTNLKTKNLAQTAKFTGVESDEIAVADPNTEVLNSLLAQFKITNLHLSLLTENTFFKGDPE